MNNLDILELFHGPTMAFKDAGARFVASFITKFHKANSRRPVGLVATTGNTGAAIANAFMRHKDKHVVILYPHGTMTRAQLAQFTAQSPNIHPVEVGGTISQCKDMIRNAMADQALAERMMPVCINTNNYLRIVPQVVFFFLRLCHAQEYTWQCRGIYGFNSLRMSEQPHSRRNCQTYGLPHR